VVNTGWQHPAILRAIETQIRKSANPPSPRPGCRPKKHWVLPRLSCRWSLRKQPGWRAQPAAPHRRHSK
jgi:hypothetical protein